MTKVQRVVVWSSVALSMLILGAALFVVYMKGGQPIAPPAPPRPVSQRELAASDGKNGHPCFVAVDGTVYKIQGFSLWQNGVHTPSNGQAYCGADMSKVIDKSPHGRKILKILIVVGPLTS